MQVNAKTVTQKEKNNSPIKQCQILKEEEKERKDQQIPHDVLPDQLRLCASDQVDCAAHRLDVGGFIELFSFQFQNKTHQHIASVKSETIIYDKIDLFHRHVTCH